MLNKLPFSVFYGKTVVGFRFLTSVLFFDKSFLNVSESSNTQNIRIWGIQNSRETRKHKLDSEKVTVWCAVYADGVADPYYFNNETVRKIDDC